MSKNTQLFVTGKRIYYNNLPVSKIAQLVETTGAIEIASGVYWVLDLDVVEKQYDLIRNEE